MEDRRQADSMNLLGVASGVFNPFVPSFLDPWRFDVAALSRLRAVSVCSTR